MYEYKKFDIVAVAESCGIKINTRTLNRAEVDAWCPFCPTESSDYHMNINREKERFYCQKCSAGGNSVSLYAKIHGIDNREAYERLSGGQTYSIPERASKPKPKSLPGYEVAPIKQRHDVYYSMLELLELSSTHMKDLTNRGLSRMRVTDNMYRTMPVNLAACRKITSELAKCYDLRGVPGFYYSGIRWELCSKPGILIPILDIQGYIQGFQIRIDGAKIKKYRWLSSNPEYGLPYGTPSSSWIHVTGNRASSEAFITEGGLKGDIASYLSGDRLFICTAGATSIRYLSDTLTALKIQKVNGCFDMDKLTELNALLKKRRENPWDEKAKRPSPLEKMEAVVKSSGLPYTRCQWAPELNGIDNYYFSQLVNHQIAS